MVAELSIEKLKRVSRWLNSSDDENLEKFLGDSLKMIPSDPEVVLMSNLGICEKHQKDFQWKTFYIGVIVGLASYEKFGRMTPAQFENEIARFRSLYVNKGDK